MQLLFNNSPTAIAGSVVVIGNFDGVHLGHQALLGRAKQLADELQLPLVLLTFEPMPREYFSAKLPSTVAPVRLQRLSEKYLCLRPVELDVMFVIRFDEEISQLSPAAFVDSILLKQLGAKVVVVGNDFRFGKKRAGDVAVLRELGGRRDFIVEEVDTVMLESVCISSSYLRELLAAGKVELVAQGLGRPYSLTGRVVFGDQRGREWGFPTANIPLFRSQSPLTGIFAVSVKGEDFIGNGVASIGYRPVFQVKKPLLEVFIFDFDRQIYGQRLQVNFLHKLRDELNFPCVDDLVAQIRLDVVRAGQFFVLNPEP